MGKTTENTKQPNLTLFGKYFKSINGKASKVEKIVGVPAKSISRLCTIDNTIIYAEDFYKIIVAAHHIAGITQDNFIVAIDYIFPDRAKANLMEEYKDYSPEAKFFKKYTQQQLDIENKLDYNANQISKYFGDNSKRGLATDIICFIEGLDLDVLKTFREIYGNIIFHPNTEDLK